MGNFNKDKFDAEYSRLPNGELAMAYLREAIREADEAEDYQWRIELRGEYMHQCCFYSDCMELYVVMPKLLKIYDEYVAQYGPDEDMYFHVLWKYKWLLGYAADFYQVSIEQFEKLSEDIKSRILGAGYSLRPYYSYQFHFYKYIDWEKAEGYYRQFQQTKRDEFSDCHACERHTEVTYLLDRDNIELARKRAQDLFDRRLTCMEVPETTYGRFLRYYNLKLCKGEHSCLEEAMDCCGNVVSAIRHNGIATEFSGDVLLNYSLTNPKKALNWFKQFWTSYEENRNPESKLYFALGMIHFIHRLQEKGPTYRMKLPGSFPLYREDGIYDLAKLLEHYESYALSCIQKLDGRNGTSHFRDIYEVIVHADTFLPIKEKKDDQ